MAVSIAQYVDLLFKKLQGVAKTANATVKGASNESIASPAFIRGDVVWMQADQIGNTAGVVSGIVDARTGASSVECTPDTTVPPIGGVRPTWLTNVEYWIPQEFGSTWLPKVFVGPTGAANIEATGTQIFAAGISGTGEYFFDTQAGVLNFIGETIPSVLTAGNVVYISGYEYVGLLGTQNLPDGTIIGNIVIANTTITTNETNGNIVLEPTGTGLVTIDTITGLTIPVGNTAQRPTPPTTGTMRFNTGTNLVEIYDGTDWINVGSDIAAVSDQTITGDGSTDSFTLDQDTTAASIIVSTNGVVQKPGTAYSVTGNVITFAEAPLTTDVVDVRFISNVQTLNELSNGLGNAVTVLDNGVADFTTIQSLELPQYTVSQANALGNVATGQVIYCTNGDSGNPCLAVYSVNAWKIVSLGGNITT